MEDVRAFPEEINRNGGLNILDDGSMTIISFNDRLYRSTDGGASWQQEETAFTKLVRELKESIIENKQVSGLVYEVGIKVLEGSISVERAVEEITKRAAIYLAE